MAIHDQYYAPRHETIGGSEVISTEQEVGRRLEEMFYCSWVNWDEISANERNLTVLVHAPSSLLDMRRITENVEDYIGLKDGSGNTARIQQEGGLELGLLPCRILGSAWLMNYIEETSSVLNIETSAVEQLIQEINRSYKEYGAFQPAHLGKFNDDDSLNPIMFSIAMVLKLRKEANENGHTGRLCVVSHPDQLYFMTNGDKGKIADVAASLEDFYRSLGIELFVENPIFINSVFRDTLGWFENPTELAQVLPASSDSFGVCIDGRHLEHLGFDGQQIDEILRNLLARGYNLALHIDQTYSVGDLERPYITTAYKNALPIAYEPRNGV